MARNIASMHHGSISAGVTNSPNRLAVKIISVLCLVTRTWTWDAAICSAISALPTLHPGKLKTEPSALWESVLYYSYNECGAEEAGWP